MTVDEVQHDPVSIKASLPHIIFAGATLIGGIVLTVLGQETVGVAMITGSMTYVLGAAQEKKI